MEAKPPSTSSGGPQKSDDKVRTLMTEVKKGKVKEEAESPSIKVGIGISAAHGSVLIKQGKPKPLLTAAQLDELRRQVVIYKYIAVGLPVPAALVLPIWKSVANSFGFGSGGIYRLCPSFVGFSPQEFDYRNMMDPEPGRCRRTDGKKWRCRKDVVPGQKYCEGHMHRGRQRSRKHVETSQTVSASNATPPNNSSKNLENSNINSSCSVPAVLSNKPGIGYKSSGSACSNVDARIIGTTKTTSVVGTPKNVSTAITPKGIAGCINAAAIMINRTVHTDSSITTAMIGTNKSGRNNSHKIEGVDDGNGNCSNSVSFENLINSGNNSRNIRNAQGATSQGLNFSPKSVLQGGISIVRMEIALEVQGCRAACFCRSDAELEPERCRRTDGKKWRCRRDVVPNEKYCKIHMHRGAKKRIEASQSHALLNATPYTSTSARLHSTAILPNKGNGTDLNTNLSIAISANPQLVTNDDTSDTTISISSDTTISNTIVASCEDGDFSS